MHDWATNELLLKRGAELGGLENKFVSQAAKQGSSFRQMMLAGSTLKEEI